MTDNEDRKRLDYMLECEAQRARMVDAVREAKKGLLITFDGSGINVIFMNCSKTDYLALVENLTDMYKDFDWPEGT